MPNPNNPSEQPEILGAFAKEPADPIADTADRAAQLLAASAAKAGGGVPGGEHAATTRPHGHRPPASLALILRGIGDDKTREYVSDTGNIYGQLSHAIAGVFDGLLQRIVEVEKGSRAPAPSPVSQPSQDSAPEMTATEAKAVRDFLDSAIRGIDWGNGRFVEVLLFVIREMLVQNRNMAQVINAGRTTLSAAYTGDHDSVGTLQHLAAVQVLQRLVGARDGFIAAVDQLDAAKPQDAEPEGAAR